MPNKAVRSMSKARSNCIGLYFVLLVVLILMTVARFAEAADKTVEKKPENKAETPQSLKPADMRTLRSAIVKYQTSQSSIMNVEKKLKMGLLGDEKNSKGKLWMASGKIRMELDGSAKTLLVMNLKNLWAVTYPPAEFKDAAIQVITGQVNTKKGRAQGIVGLLSQGGLLKFFKPTGVQKNTEGEAVYFLQPYKQDADFTRAQVTLAKTANRLLSFVIGMSAITKQASVFRKLSSIRKSITSFLLTTRRQMPMS
jgi:hypothetical protein